MRLYIDPGTGSMLFTVLIGIVGAALYSLRMLFIKLRFRLSGGKAQEDGKTVPFVIFSDDKRYWTVFEPICREMDRRGQDLVYMTASEDDPALSSSYPHVKAEFIGKGNRAYARLNILRAGILLSTTPGLDVYQWKRSREVRYYVHLPHAASDLTMYRMFGLDYYDAVLLSGEYQERQIRALEQLRGLPAKELRLVGIPYMDEMAARLEQAGPAPAHPRTVLLAPSWGPSALFSVYGSRILDLLLQTGYHVIVRPHPQSFTSEKEMIDRLMGEYPASGQLEWNRDADNFEVLRRSDILISDFSGVIFDFALVYDKPVLYTDPKFDLSVYDAWWLKEPPWTVGALPRLGQELTEENLGSLKELIDACLDDPKYAESRRRVAARTVDYLLERYEALGGEEK